MSVDLGLVFKWINYPHQIDGQIKPRWFIVISISSELLDPPPVIIWIATTTTDKKGRYKIGGERHHLPHLVFKVAETPFDQDCIFDPVFINANETCEKSRVETDKDFEIKGSLKIDLLRSIYKLIQNCKDISPKLKKRIGDGFRNKRII